MTNNLQIFNSEEFGQVRIVSLEGREYFVAKDIANVLGYSNPRDAISRHCRGVVKHDSFKESGNTISLIPEGDVYRLIARSKLPQAEKFESWVFDDVLPTIRKTGGFVANEEQFIDTYLPFADEPTKQLFKTTLTVITNQNQKIKQQQLEIKHKEDVIIGLVDEITLAEKRQILNRVVRKCKNYSERWSELYKNFEMKYHINLTSRFESYNENHKPKMTNKLDYIDKVMNKIPELYDIACKLYENDVKALVNEMYALHKVV